MHITLPPQLPNVLWEGDLESPAAMLIFTHIFQHLPEAKAIGLKDPSPAG